MRIHVKKLNSPAPTRNGLDCFRFKFKCLYCPKLFNVTYKVMYKNHLKEKHVEQKPSTSFEKKNQSPIA